MIKLTKEEEDIRDKYKMKCGGRYPPYNGINWWENRKGIMIISFCPIVKKKNTESISSQLKVHYKILIERRLSNTHLTDFIKFPMSTDKARKYIKGFKKNLSRKEELQKHANIIKWEIEQFDPTKILVMGNNANKLLDDFLKQFFKAKGIKPEFIPHYTNLRHKKAVDGYFEVMNSFKKKSTS